MPEFVISPRWIALWSGLLVGGLVLPQIEAIVLVVAALWALRGAKGTMEALFVLAFYLMGNRTFVDGQAANLRYLILFVGFLTLFFRRGSRKNSLRKVLWAFFLTTTSVSFFASYLPTISVLKAISFFLGTYVIVEGFAQTRHLRNYWFKVVNTFFVFIIGSSFLFLLVGFGYELNGRGFQGIMNHPQTFGPTLGVVTAWFIGLWVADNKLRRRALLLASTGLVFIFLSQARTGVIALGAGGAFAYLLSQKSRATGRLVGRIRNVVIAVSLAALVFVLVNPSVLTEVILPFVQKREAATTDFGELFNQSRGELATSSMGNFYHHPVFGIGLGVPSIAVTGEEITNIKYLGGIPVGASIEKGFLPSAILEEMGLIGMIFTVIILWVIIQKLRKSSSFLTMWIFTAALFINVGEAVFYSLGGIGFFVWMMFGLCYNFEFFAGQTGKRRRDKETKQLSSGPQAEQLSLPA